MTKVCDAVFSLPAEARNFWPASEHEPLIVGLILHFSPLRPWQVKQAGGILDLERELREAWMSESGSESDILHKFCHELEWMGCV